MVQCYLLNIAIMQTVYILKSLKDNFLYIGCTSNLDKRISEHNSGVVYSTKNRRPLVLIYCESYLNQKEAWVRESNLKLYGRARAQLFKRINKSIELIA
jgi:putative endonuclease